MPTPLSLKTGLDPRHPVHFSASDDGWMYFANGIDDPFRWDGENTSAIDAGLAAPTSALTLTETTTSLPRKEMLTGLGNREIIYVDYDPVANLVFVAYGSSVTVLDHRGNVQNTIGFSAITELRGIQADQSTGTIAVVGQNSAPTPGDSGVLRLRTIGYDGSGESGHTLQGAFSTGTITGVSLSPTVVSVAYGDNDISRAERDGTALAATTTSGVPLDTMYARYDGRQYYTNTSNQVRRQVGTWGSGDTLLFTSSATLKGLFVENPSGSTGHIWTVRHSGDDTIVQRANLDGTSNATQFTETDFLAGDIAYDRNHDVVYMVDSNTGTLWRIPADGSDPTRIFRSGATYSAYMRAVDVDGRASALGPASEELEFTQDGITINYSGLDALSSPASKKQIFRNTNGQSQVYYLDVDDIAIAATTSSSSNSDTDIKQNTFLTVSDSLGRPVLGNPGLPRTDKPLLAFSRGRMFMAGEVIIDQGSVTVANGSATIQGNTTTNFSSNFVGRFFRAKGDNTSYEIQTVTDSDTLVLTSNYSGTGRITEYEIRSAPAERAIVYWSEADNFDAWDPLKGIAVGSTGEGGRSQAAPTAIFEQDSFLYICQERSIFRLAYATSPEEDGALFLNLRRGCINNRAWAQIGSATYLMDEQGIYKFEAGRDEHISQPIQNFFRREAVDDTPRINWQAKKWFHATVDFSDQVIRFFVALIGERKPKHALAFRYSTNEWWLEEYPHYVMSSESLPDFPRFSVVGAQGDRLLAFGLQSTDLIDPESPDLRVPATGGGVLTLTYDSGTYSPSLTDLPGVPVSIVSGKGKGQSRVIVTASAGVITVRDAWTIKPDSTSVFQIGGIPWEWKSRRFRWIDELQSNRRKINVTFEPLAAGNLDIRERRDFSDQPETYGGSINEGGVRIKRGEDYAEVDLSTAGGYVRVDLDGTFEPRAKDGNHREWDLRGWSSSQRTKLYGVTIEGTMEGDVRRRRDGGS